MTKERVLELFKGVEKELIYKQSSSAEIDISLTETINKTNIEKILVLFYRAEQELLNLTSRRDLKVVSNKKEIDKSFARAALGSFFINEKSELSSNKIKSENLASPYLSFPQATDLQSISNSLIDLSLNLIASFFISNYLFLDNDFTILFNSNELLLQLIPFMSIFCLCWVLIGTFQLAIWGKTVGSRIVGILIISEEGYLPGFKKALLRTLSQIPVFLTFGLINLVFLRKIYFHDFVAGTRKVSLVKK